MVSAADDAQTQAAAGEVEVAFGPDAGALVWLVGALIVVAAVTGVRVWLLHQSPLTLQFDEAQYWSWGQGLAFGYYSKPPMIGWLIGGTTALCGQGEACVRLSAPILHGLTALTLFALTRTVGGSRPAAFAASVGFLTLPGVALSSVLISTDVPLLLFWALSMIGLWRLVHDGGPITAALTGLALGLGLLSKYAMLYVPLSVLLLMSLSSRARARLLSRNGAILAAVGGLTTAPHLLWNAQMGWPTVGHTADNANWQGFQLDPGAAFEFLAGQMLVIGPVLFLVLLGWLLRPMKGGPSDREVFLFSFIVPVLLLMLVQALLSRAHANWAATAYVSGMVAVAIWTARTRPRLLTAALSVNVVLAVGIAALTSGGVSMATAPKAAHAVLHRMAGWAPLSDRLTAIAEAYPGTKLLFDERKLMASLLYQLRDLETDGPRLVRFADSGKPTDHYQMTRPWVPEPGEGVLYITQDPRTEIISRFANQFPVGDIVVKTVGERQRAVSVLYLKDPAL